MAQALQGSGVLWASGVWLMTGLIGTMMGSLVWLLSEWLPANIRGVSFEISRESVPGFRLLPMVCCGISLLVAAILPARLLPASLLLSWILLALIVIDLRYLLLPDVLTLSLLWLGLLGNVAGVISSPLLTEALVGAAAGFTVLALLSYGYRMLCGKEGLGLGDAKLLAALGAWLGVFRLPILVLMASLASLIALGIMQWVSGHPLRDPFPFGAALALSGWLLFICSYFSA